ncbi:hypothetical protein OAZ06_00155 [Synechococcus sp. AH-736-G20]|nr:hypothetical protein [Synechococcus sp. AH-736-G20]
MTSLIITTAMGYRPADIWPFLASAHRYCPDSSIIAIVHYRDLELLSPCSDYFPSLSLYPIYADLKDIRHARGLRYKFQRALAKLRSFLLSRLSEFSWRLCLADEQPSFLGLSSLRMFILNRRFFIARNILYSCSKDIDAVLLTDSRDVVFQDNPFKVMNRGLFTGQEINSLRDSPINAQWIRTTYGEDGFERLKDFPVYCSGVTIGDIHSVRGYLDQFCFEISCHAVANRSVLIPIWDQAYHNMILRQEPPSNFRAMPWNSDLSTLGEVPNEFLEVLSDGYIAVDGIVPSILHQYDRHPDALLSIMTQYSAPSSFTPT